MLFFPEVSKRNYFQCRHLPRIRIYLNSHKAFSKNVRSTWHFSTSVPQAPRDKLNPVKQALTGMKVFLD